MSDQLHNLTESLSVLGKGSHLSISQRQKIRDQLFKKIGQATLIDAVQTQTEVSDLIMPVDRLRAIFQPRRFTLGLPAMIALIGAVFMGTLATGAFAQEATAGDPFFNLHKTLEAVQIALTPDPTAKAQLQVSIAQNRVNDAISSGPVSGPKLATVLEESKTAINNAQSAVIGLQHADGKAAQDLATQLTQVIAAQQGILDNIVQNKVGDDTVQQSVIAMRDDLNKLLPAVVATADGKTPVTGSTAVAINTPATGTAVTVTPSDKPTASTGTATTNPTTIDTVTTPEQTTINGSLTSLYGLPALNNSDQTYILLNSPVDLSQYIGRSNVVVVGRLTAYGFVVERITIDNKLIGTAYVDSIGTPNALPGAATNKNDTKSSGVESVPN